MCGTLRHLNAFMRRKALSRTVYNIFLPSLLLTNVVKTLAKGGSSQLAFLPLAAVAQVTLGFVIGIIGARILRLSSQERRVYLVCCGFGNSAALPLLFANALFDAPAQLVSIISSISFFLLGWTGLFWSLGYHLLATLPDDYSNGTRSVTGPDGLASKMKQVMIRILSPPLVASCLGLVIGTASPAVRDVFIASPLFSALSSLASGYTPAAVLILAGSLARRPPTGISEEHGRNLRVPRMTLGISLTRFLFMPTAAMVMIAFGKTSIFKPPMVRLALLLESIMPPAQNSTLILNMEGKQDAASAVARVLMVTYLIGILPISIGLSLFLGVAGLQ